MAYQQVRDVVDEIRQAHQQIERALKQSLQGASEQETQQMLTALSREERELQLILARYGAIGEEGMLDIWLQYVPDDDVLQAVTSIEFTPDMSADDAVLQKLEFDQALIALLLQLAEETSVPRVQEFFKSLLVYVKSRTAQQVWGIRKVHAADSAAK